MVGLKKNHTRKLIIYPTNRKHVSETLLPVLTGEHRRNCSLNMYLNVDLLCKYVFKRARFGKTSSRGNVLVRGPEAQKQIRARGTHVPELSPPVRAGVFRNLGCIFQKYVLDSHLPETLCRSAQAAVSTGWAALPMGIYFPFLPEF